jgi:glycosyltransferase involved in cell wall biosynthesis
MYRPLAAQIITARAPVILAGERTDLADLVHAADVAVVTTEGEASSLFIQEVLVAGIPLVCTTVDGVPELVGGAAVLIPPGDVEALDTAVQSLLQDPGRRQARASAGRALARAWPTETEAVRRVLTVYAELGATDDQAEDDPGGDSRDAPRGTR